MIKRRSCRGQRGQAMIEMVLVFPMLLVLFVGFLGAGTLLLHKIKCCMAVREAAVKISRQVPAQAVESWLKGQVCGGPLGLQASGLSLRVTSAASTENLSGSILQFIEGVTGDLSGQRVEVIYQEKMPSAWLRVMGRGIILKETCVILREY